MQYVSISEYPYDSHKKFFLTQEEALVYTPPQWLGWRGNSLLNTRVWRLERYSEQEVKGRIIINYSVVFPSLLVAH